MKTWRDGTATVVTLVLLVSLVAGPAQARLVRGQPRGPSPYAYQSGHELVFEGGLAVPLGDQKDEFWTTETGIDAGSGYELGLRYRYYMSDSWAVSPSFHYVRFGSFSDVGDFPEGDDLGFEIRASLYRYSLDFQFFTGPPMATVRPYLTAGVALAHNIYRDELQYYGVFKEAVDTAAFNLGLGLKMGVIEMAGVYHFNRFATSNFTSGPEKVDFNWDYATVSAGFAFGRH